MAKDRLALAAHLTNGVDELGVLFLVHVVVIVAAAEFAVVIVISSLDSVVFVVDDRRSYLFQLRHGEVDECNGTWIVNVVCCYLKLYLLVKCKSSYESI